MRKAISYIMALILAVTLLGCKSEKPQESGEANTFDIKSATNVVNTYMKYLMKEDYENAKRLYSQDLLSKLTPISDGEMKVKGFNMSEINEVGKSGVFKVKVTRTNINKASASLDEYTFKVIKDGAEYKISEVSSSSEKEAFYERGGIRFRSKDNIKTNLIIDASGIPQYAFSKDDKANVYKLPVPRNNFTNASFSYSGDKLGICTYDKNSYIGIIKIDESLAVQGGEDQGGAGGEGPEGQKGGTNVMPREKPIGKEISSVDVLKDSKVEFMTFSLDEKFMLAQYKKGNVGRCIRIYKSDSGELIPVKFENNYPIDKVEIIFSSFDKGVVYFEVLAKGNIGKNEADIVGKWVLDLKEFKVKRA